MPWPTMSDLVKITENTDLIYKLRCPKKEKLNLTGKKGHTKHETTTTYGSIEHDEFTFLKSSILSLKWLGLR